MGTRRQSLIRSLTLMGAAGAALIPQYAWAGQPAVALDIGTQDLGTALTDFARQSKQQLLFSPDLVRGKRAQPLHGSYSPEEGLAQLLSGTGVRYRTTPSGTFILVAQASTTPAAQTASAPAPAAGPSEDLTPDAPEAGDAEEIIVLGTAGGGTRRQDAAFAVTSLDDEVLERAAPASTAEAFELIPGVSSESSGGQNGANIFVRGFPSGGDAQFVTLQLEGVPFFPPSTLSFLENSQLFRIDETLGRIEAVRGGTGALFGAGQPGLTVNFVQKKGGDTFEGLGKLSVTDFGEVRGDAYVSGPLGPDTSFLVGGYYANADGIRDPEFTGEKGGQISANVSHRFDRGELLVFARYLDDHGQWLLPIPVIQNGEDISEFPGFDAGTGTLVGNETRLSVLNDGTRVDLSEGRGAQIVNLGTNFEFEINDALLIRDRASYLKGDADTVGLVPAGAPRTAAAYAAALGGTIGSLTFTNGGGAVADAANQQVIQAGTWLVRKDIESFVNDFAVEFKTGSNTLTGGAYYASYSAQDRWNLGNGQLLTAEPNARRLDLVLADGRRATRNGFVQGSFFNVNASYDGTDYAFYLVDEFQITPELRVDGGVRWQRHEVDGTLENNTSGVDTDGDPNTLYNNNDAVLNGTFSTIEYRGDKFSWTAGANYDFTDDLGVFLRYSRGHTFPFFDNLRDGLDQIQKVDSYEAGLKVSTDPIRIYATIFRNDFDGLATTQIVSGAPIPATGGAKTTGVELEGALTPIENLSIGFSGTYLHAEYRDFFSNSGLIDNSGNRVQRQPRWTWRIAPVYEIEFGNESSVALFTSLTYVGDRFSDVENQQALPHFYKWDAGVSFALNDHLSFQVTGDNLTDEIGLTEGNPRIIGSSGAGVILARPILGRSFRFSASYRF